MSVLIVSSSADQHVNFMLKRMKKRGVKNFRFDLDKLGEGLSVTYTPNSGHEVKNCRGQRLALPFDINSVWFRKPFMTRSSWLNKKPIAAFSGKETESYLQDLVLCLDGNCHWVNNPENNRRADNKLNQLRLAKSLGLSVPETIVSNDPKAIRGFAHQLAPRQVIYKTLCSPFVKETEKTYASVYTTPIKLTADIIQAIKPVPCLIQEYVDKAYELRITVVGEQVFATKIFSQDYPSTTVDWRRDQHKIQLRQELIDLDSHLRRFCIEIVRQLGLVFGAIDIIITPEDRPVFLEINPNGQWAWIEYTLGAPISDALIDELTKEKS